MGRPSGFTEEVATIICDRIAQGESLRSIGKDADMPGPTAILSWLGKFPAFAAQYARARELQMEFYAQQIIDIADTPVEGVRREEGVDGEGKDYSKTIIEDALGQRRLQIDARKWIMSKLAPKKYGDRTLIGSDPEAPVTLVHRIERAIVDPKQITED